MSHNPLITAAGPLIDQAVTAGANAVGLGHFGEAIIREAIHFVLDGIHAKAHVTIAPGGHLTGHVVPAASQRPSLTPPPMPAPQPSRIVREGVIPPGLDDV